MLLSKFSYLASVTFLVLAASPRILAQENQSCEFKFITQEVDHFGKANGTFQQRYNIVTDFFQPGGPILLFQGEESTTLDCVVGNHKYNSLSAQLISHLEYDDHVRMG